MERAININHRMCYIHKMRDVSLTSITERVIDINQERVIDTNHETRRRHQ